ncbi:MAG: hypothetical protein LJU34_01025 [Oscillospiraceae bacterium]|nr:hypothetical protein [Oscillospiraceae bacterium]
MKKLRERLNVFVVKTPSMAILLGILLLNILLFVVAALIISALAPSSLESSGFWVSVFYTVSMILDAGCISYVIADVGEAGVGLVIVCMLTVIIGMITFTGAVIGYVTNAISNFIDNSKSGRRALKISGHTVILNWNNRASEIVNDMLYTGKRDVIVILVNDGAEAVERELNDRLSDTVHREHVKNRLTVIVREGETFSSKQLADISILTAKNVIILSSDFQSSMCKYDYRERREEKEYGNSNTVKTLVQVAEFTSSSASADNQIIVVEVEDLWTHQLVNKIIFHKERLGKCNIIPVPVNKILGQLLSQFSVMPELNAVYSTLFSNKGAEFFCRPYQGDWNETEDVSRFLAERDCAIPMTAMTTKTGPEAFYIADQEEDVDRLCAATWQEREIRLNPDYWLSAKNVIIIGHNSKSMELMKGFDAFRGEWMPRDGSEILNLLIIDDEKSLEKRGFYRDYPYVRQIVEADIYESDKIAGALNAFLDATPGQVSILILSDDNARPESIDAGALAYLIFVQGILTSRTAEDGAFDPGRIDIIVEILNPKNYDVVHDFSANNVVISNRYISKMVTQISAKEALYEFYCDILTYDEEGADVYESKELYIKPAAEFLAALPGRCTAAQLIRGIYNACPPDNKAILIGYVDGEGNTVLFTGRQDELWLELTPRDKLIIFSNH